MDKFRFSSKPRQPKSFQFVAVKNAKRGSSVLRKSQHTGRKLLISIFGALFGLVIIAGIVGAIVITGYIGTINANLPNAGEYVKQDMEQGTKIFDRNGKLLYTRYGEFNREFVKLSELPDKTKWALLAAEDVEFYEHQGVDIPGMVSALLDYIRTGTRSSRGASTITQQLARTSVLFKVIGAEAYERTYSRKIKEILISFQLENKLTKDEILELYINEINLGGTLYGYQTASRAYFSKSVKDLTLAESALLAIIPRAPSEYNNALFNNDTETAKKYRDIVLDLMLKYKDKTNVTEEEIAAAKAEPIKITPGTTNITAPHFVFYVIEQLEKMYGADMVRNGGLRVTTTLDLSTQKIAEEELKKHIAYSNKMYGVYNGAVVINNPKNGEILAMVGSVNYNNTKDKRVDGNVNVAVMPRQMGSSVKPFTYLAAIVRGYNPGTLTPDIPMNFGAYKPANWNFKYDGLLTMRRAMNQSRNLPAVYTLQMIGGAPAFIETAEKLGITTLTQKDRYGLSLTLGAGDMKLIEHANAFAVFANRGVRHDISTIQKVTDPKGNVLFQSEPQKTAKRVFNENDMYLLNWMSCMIAGDTDKLAAVYYSAAGQKLCGKTGTTNGPKDLLTSLYYPRLVVDVWAGNNNGAITIGARQGWSENVPIVIANRIMARLVPKYGKEFYTQPSDVAFTTVCTDTGLTASADTNCKKFSTPIIRGKGPEKDTAHKMLPICVKTGKVASNEAEARANGLVKDTLYLDFKLPNAAQQKYYDSFVTSKLKYKLWSAKPDEEPCYPDIGISISSPADGAVYNPGDVITVNATVSSVNAINSVTILIGSSSRTFSPSGFTYSHSYTVPSGASSGSITITATATDSLGVTATTSRTLQIVVPAPTPTPTPSPTPTASPT